MIDTFTPVHHDAESNKQLRNTLVCGWRPIWESEPSRLRERILQSFRHCKPGSCMTFLNYVSLEKFETMMAALGIFPTHFEHDPDEFYIENESKLYIITSHTLFVRDEHDKSLSWNSTKHQPNMGHVFIRHIVGDAADALTLDPIIQNTSIHSAIVMGTQQNFSTRMDSQLSLSQSPKAGDTRVLCIFLLLRKLLEKKHSMYPDKTEPMHGE